MTDSIFGRGLAYPVRLDAAGAKNLVVSEEENVRSCMRHIMGTDMYTRPFTVKNGVLFGTRIRRALFEPEDVAKDIAVYDTKMALTVWEPRIVVKSVTADWTLVGQAKRRALVVTVFFVYRKTNRADNLVVPFYQGKWKEAA